GVELLGEILQDAGRRIRELDARVLLLLLLLDPALHLAHRIQIVVDHRLVRGAERALQVRGVVLDQVEDALALVDDLVTLRRIVALAEQAIENLARVVLHRQRLRGSAERNGPGVTATEARVAGAAAAFTGEL